LHPVAKPGDLIYGGKFCVCRARTKGRIYGEDGYELATHEIQSYAGKLFTDTPEPVEYRGVRNWFDGECGAEFGVSEIDELRSKRWGENYETNKPLITRAASDVEPSDVLYLCASGPSIERNAPELLKVTRGKKLAVNWTLDWAAKSGLGASLFDYFMCIDYHLQPKDWGEFPDTTAIFDVCVNNAVAQTRFKDRIWFTQMAQTGNPVAQKAVAEHPELPQYEAGLNVTFSALQWAAFGLKAKTIVLVGLDSALTYGRYHCGTWADYKFWHPAEYLVVPDNYGVPVVTVKGFADMADWMHAAFFFMRQAGIRIINATEGGVIREHCELKTLADTVAELNGGKP
jgi:hypothetical protein